MSDSFKSCAFSSVIFQDLIDFECRAIALKLHRAAKTGTLNLNDSHHSKEGSVFIKLQTEPTLEAQLKSHREQQANQIIECANCGHRISVFKYAPHLDKCMLGKGARSQNGGTCRSSGSAASARVPTKASPSLALPKRLVGGGSVGRPRKNSKVASNSSMKNTVN
mmetsp:Transcript_48436/g.97456  ORF Transcript_48436/g.97456 Transcript_48436/m.97456 type:complete len:165 (+) Transcript_48436:91-585(+)